jgi:hypothetical protein
MDSIENDVSNNSSIVVYSLGCNVFTKPLPSNDNAIHIDKQI